MNLQNHRLRADGWKFKPHNVISTKTVSSVLLSHLIARCTTIELYTGEQRTSRAVQYGAIGVGACMDARQRELREELAGTSVLMQCNGDELQFIMPGNVSFPTDGYSVRSGFMPVLDSVARILYKVCDTRLQVIGLTDSSGARSYNYALSNWHVELSIVAVQS